MTSKPARLAETRVLHLFLYLVFTIPT